MFHRRHVDSLTSRRRMTVQQNVEAIYRFLVGFFALRRLAAPPFRLP